jgi:H/ACA ribonucleoprotein complex non-core subunit NAF1
MSDYFKVPQSVPQDLLLIQGFVDAPPPSTTTTTSVLDDSISSSSEEEEASEEEIAANLTKGTATDDDDISVTAYVSLPLLSNLHVTKTSL